MPGVSIGNTKAEYDKIARKQINLSGIERVWHSLCSIEQANVNNTIVYINNWTLELNEPLDKAFGTKVSLEEEKRQAEDESANKEIEKNIAKQDKTINALQKKKKHYGKIIEEFDKLDDLQKLIASIILAGAAGKQDDDYMSFVTTLLLQRYREREAIASRLNFLKDDVSVDVLSYQQFTYLLNLRRLYFLFCVMIQKLRICLKKIQFCRKYLKNTLSPKRKR